MRDASRRRMKVECGSLLLVRSNQERVFSREDQCQRLGIGGGDQGVDTREAVIVSVTGTRQRGRTLGRFVSSGLWCQEA